MTRIAIGQYYPSNSVVHRIDPRFKLLGTIFYITALFFVNNFIGYAVAALFIFLLIKLSKVPVLFLFRGLRAIMFILCFAVILNLFMTPGETVLFSLWIITITREGVLMAAQMAARLVLLITGSSILTLTTSPIQLTDGLESLLKPLKVIRVPAHDIAMMMTIALRFIPTLAEEMDKIMKAQKARGADLDTGGLLKRAKSLLPILVPLFVSAFKRADELATAMEARCYRGDLNRTRMKVMKITSTDWIAVVVLGMYGALLFLTRLL